jgi:hypothetical protein
VPDQPSYWTPPGAAPGPLVPQPYPPMYPPMAGYGPAQPPSEPLATTAIVLGVLSIVFSLMNLILPIVSGLASAGLAVTSLILAARAKQRIAQSGGALGGEGMIAPARVTAITALVLNVGGFLLAALVIGLLAGGGATG